MQNPLKPIFGATWLYPFKVWQIADYPRVITAEQDID